MWRSKKSVIIIGLLAAVLLVGSIAGVALARTGSGSPAGVLLTQNVSDNASQPKTLPARVAAILGIDQQKLEDAVAQAQRQMQEEALGNYLKNLVDQGKITQEQADQYKSWWQSRPDMTPYQQQLKDWQQARPGIPPELKDWQQARPDMPLPGLFRGHGGFGGPRGFRGWHYPVGTPPPPTSPTQ